MRAASGTATSGRACSTRRSASRCCPSKPDRERTTQTCPACRSTNDEAAEVCFHCRAILRAITRGTLVGGRYEIVLPLGRGGMGTVYRARDRVLDEDVALKVLRPDLAHAGEMEARFRAEIKLARTVTHPNVCRIHEYGEDGPLRFISMELVDGENLKERVRRAGPLPAAEATRIGVDIARGLEAIHDAGVVHRDLSPFNVTLDARGRVRVMDFGIAKHVAAETAGAAAGYVLGNPEYMSPEQARGRRVDTRTDLYSLGVVVFEMLTGRPPFRGDTPVETLLRHADTAPPLDDPGIPPGLRPVLARALAKEPEQRYGSALAMAEALRACGAGTRPLHVSRLGRLGLLAALPALVALAAALWLLPVAPASSPAPTPGSPDPTTASAPPAGSMEGPAPPAAAMPRPAPSRAPSTPPATATAAPPSTAPAPAPSTLAPASAPSPTPQSPAAASVGWLQVGVTPWADVAVDQEIVGQTPMPPIPLAPGVHDVLLSHPDFRPFPRRVTIRSGETLRLIVDLSSDGIRRPR